MPLHCLANRRHPGDCPEAITLTTGVDIEDYSVSKDVAVNACANQTRTSESMYLRNSGYSIAYLQ